MMPAQDRFPLMVYSDNLEKVIQNNLAAKNITVASLHMSGSVVWRTATTKLLIYSLLVLTAQNGYKSSTIKDIVTVDNDQFQQLAGYQCTPKMREKVRSEMKQSCIALYNLSVDWVMYDRKTQKKYVEGGSRIITDWSMKASQTVIRFNSKIANQLLQSFLTHFPVDALSLSCRNQLQFYLVTKLAVRYFMKSAIKANTNDFISIKSLISGCPFLVSQKQVRKTDRHIKQRIIAPLLKALQDLKKRNIITYNFTLPKKKMYVGDIEHEVPDKFMSLYLSYNFPGSEEVMKQLLEPETKTA